MTTLGTWSMPGGETVAPIIAGAPDTSRAGTTFPSIDPATGQVLAHVVQCDRDHVDDAVTSAREAQRAWMRRTPAERGRCLLALADLVLDRFDHLAMLDTRDMGRPIRDATAGGPGTAELLRHWAGWTDKIFGQQYPVTPGHLSWSVREPLGVIAAIVPWNAPLQTATARIAAAVACGNAVVLKPSEHASLSALRLGELCTAAGMPEGLVNVLTGDGAVGQLLAGHPDVDGISFTGSVETGRRVAAAAARELTPLTLELGGKSPNVVFADADLDQAVRGTTWGVFYNAGQVCCAGTRLLVEQSIADVFVERLVDATRRIRVGNPLDRSMHLGPLVCRAQYERVLHYLDVGRQEADVAVGGTPDASSGTGFFVAPTILTNVEPGATVTREEIFGPVLTVQPFGDDDEALALANDTEYGLAANIWTRDVGRVARFADRLDAGNVWCNTARLYDPTLPFGGFKHSGIGNAAGGAAIEHLTRTKGVTVRWDASAPSPGWGDLIT